MEKEKKKKDKDKDRDKDRRKDKEHDKPKKDKDKGRDRDAPRKSHRSLSRSPSIERPRGGRSPSPKRPRHGSSLVAGPNHLPSSRDNGRDSNRDSHRDKERDRDRDRDRDKDRERDRDRQHGRDSSRGHHRHQSEREGAGRGEQAGGEEGGSSSRARGDANQDMDPKQAERLAVSNRASSRANRGGEGSGSRSQRPPHNDKDEGGMPSPRPTPSATPPVKPAAADNADPQPKPQHTPGPHPELSAEEAAAAAAQARRAAEAEELDAEVERRRRRVEAWRASRAAEQAAAAADSQAAQGGGGGGSGTGGEAGAGAGEGGQQGGGGGTDETGKGGAGWSLEDDDEDDNAHLNQGGEEAEDPLDAFMRGNTSAVAADAKAAGSAQGPGTAPLKQEAAQPRQQAASVKMEEDGQAAAAAEEEVNPLDAFMSCAVLPKVVFATPGGPPAAAPSPAPPSAPSADHSPTPMHIDPPSAPGSLPPLAVKVEATTPTVKQEPSAAAPTGPTAPTGNRIHVNSRLAVGSGRPGSGVMAVGGRSLGPGPRAGGGAGQPSLTTSAANDAAASTNVGQAAKKKGVAGTGGGMRGSGRRRVVGRGASSGSDSGSEDEEESEEEDDAEWARLVTSGKMTKGDKLGLTDHSRMNYAPFRKAFYTEVPELSRMTPEQVATLRKELDGIKVRGVDVPKPIKAWTQAGLHSKVLEVLRKSGCTQPLPIQAQALPVIMSGRDCIGIAKTGSGKTLAFVLPLLRHAKDQPPLAVGDGPIGLIMAPTRELVQQISKEVKKLAKLLDMSCTAVFGGSGVANQISELKRGVEVVVCTPGRMIDLLATSNGKITNLRRVTYLVMDEADRMFDMGFEPQIMRIVQNIRPDKQTVMFSATFPRSVETLARKVLDNPVEIQVGGRSVVNSDITQIVEIRPEADRFLRLLEVLGEWYERGKLLIFVQSQDKCDCLFRDLLKHGYPCLSLHGGKDQMDRESTISDFKAGVSNILVATSVAARGLDVSSLVLVLNYDVPNHHEDYVHRVGRTGRAGAKGTAITFVGPDEDKYAPDLVKALKESGAPVPQDLQEMADGFIGKRKAGLVAGHGSGYGGSGFKFDAGEADKVKAIRKAAAKEFGVEADPASDSSDDDIRRVTVGGPTPTPQVPGPHPPPGNPPIFAIDMGSTTSVAAASAAAAAAASQVMNQQAAVSHSQAMQALHMQGAVEAAVAAMAKQAAATQAAGTSSGSGGQAQPPAINPAILMAQQVAARIGAGAVPGTLTASAPIMSAPPAAGVANPLVAAALSALPGVQLSRPAQGMIAPPRPPPISQLMAINPANAQTAVQRAAALASQYGSSGSSMRPGVLGAGGWDAGAAATQGAAQAPQQHYEAELEINDFPQHARWKVTHRDMVNFVAETTGAALIVKGRFVEPGKQPPPGERKIYMLIEGPTELSVKRAKQELKRVLEECTEKAMRRDAPAGPGRYSVV